MRKPDFEWDEAKDLEINRNMVFPFLKRSMLSSIKAVLLLKT